MTQAKERAFRHERRFFKHLLSLVTKGTPVETAHRESISPAVSRLRGESLPTDPSGVSFRPLGMGKAHSKVFCNFIMAQCISGGTKGLPGEAQMS